MSDVDIAALEQRMLNGEPFTYMQLCVKFTRDRDLSRIVDRTIQRLRKAGLIAFTREGGRPCLASRQTGGARMSGIAEAINHGPPSRPPYGKRWELGNERR